MSTQSHRRCAAALLLVAAGRLSGAEPPAPPACTVPKLLVRDVACTGPGSEGDRRGPTLDLYGPARTEGGPRPIVLFVHGGGWRFGDKSAVGEKPAAFVARGFLLASVGYRLDPPVTPRDQGADVAAAVAWLRRHAGEYNGDGKAILLIGHSAGAHLAALVATDDRLLGRHGLEPAALGGVILLDGAGYDVPRQIEAARLPRLRQIYRDAFGDDLQAQREASPIEHVAPGRRYPPFLIMHVGERRDSREQAEALAARLRAAGGRATTVHEPDKTHMTLNRDLGGTDDGPTNKVFEFLDDAGAGQ